MDTTELLLVLILMVLACGIGCLACDKYTKMLEARRTGDTIRKISDSLLPVLITVLMNNRSGSAADGFPFPNFFRASANGFPDQHTPFPSRAPSSDTADQEETAAAAA